MRKCYFTIFFSTIFTANILLAQPSLCLEKIVSLPTNNVSLKIALQSLGNQTGCAFSYNPLLINDSQNIVPKFVTNISLEKALRKILAPAIEFSVVGKYILLQKTTKNVQPKKTNSSKFESKIDRNPKKVALVIPLMEVTEEQTYSVLRDSLIYLLPSEMPLLQTEGTSTQQQSKNSFYKNSTDSAEVRRLKLKRFFLKNVQSEWGISSSSPLSSVLAQIGLFKLYAMFSLSTDYNNSYRIGYGIGYVIDFNKSFKINLQAERSTLFAGKSYEVGVRASLIHADVLVSYDFSRDFSVFFGPSFYQTGSNYLLANTDLGTTYGVGALIGIKFNLISALFSKK
ncbi:MAG: hypothetical protein AUK44_02145 [Porphyromonadaceae bacterium CG2_30_38_12]|nr:MAG: hypothetical protein AUK44_02145 [Porphyromonadaceae bacterium CG2_30_38_12]